MSGGSVAIDVDLPAGQSRSEPRVLALFPDGERKLIFIYRNLDALFLRIEDQILHLRRLERFEHKFLWVRAPTNDVDLFIVELADDVFHPRSAHADASADRIDFLIRAGHGDLGAIAGLARDPADFHGAVVNFAHFQLEQTPDEIRVAARDDDLRPANPVLDRDDVGAQPVSDAVVFDHDTFPLRHDRFELPEVEDHSRAVETPDGAAHALAR